MSNDTHSVRLGNEHFRFTSYSQWVNKAASWFRGARLYEHSYICIDSAGRICRIGKHFMRARDEQTFPIIVYDIELQDQESEGRVDAAAASR